MTQKIKTLKLSHGAINYSIASLGERHKMENRLYVVEQIGDTTEYIPGQTLTKKEVDVLCASAQWKVTMVNKS